VLTVTLLTAVVPVTASATSAVSRGAAPAAGQAGRSYRVTLLTGDVVTYTVPAGGQPSATVDAATRSGPPPAFSISSSQNGYYVVPSDASPYVASGLVDRELFDVKELVAEGLDDAGSKTLPLLLGYADHPNGDVLTRRAHALPAVGGELSLPGASITAVRVDRGGATGFWQALVGGPTGARFGAHALTDNVSKVSLDRRVRASAAPTVKRQSQGTQQIGAPAAWAAGLDGTGVKVAVLDTGIDTGHPDLAGRVVAAANFTSDPDTGDGFGHGTHVASILAGTGAASGGRYRGVADGVRLLNGKVLDSTGYGSESSVMAGMEWAVQSGARIVNMSLGGGTTDGTDPLSQLVDSLTEQTGVLFVVAAGNDGAAMQVETPAAAEDSLAVGAVDSAYNVASFSSSGPRLRDAAVKPEVTAPGVGIIAARARGTSLGDPVNDQYTEMSGTSMATPHVAGMAALFAQAHPDWHATELKALLTSSAKDVGAPWYEQGSGCVDVPKAMHSESVGPPTLSLGRLSVRSGKMTRAVTYTNLTPQPVALALKVSMAQWDGSPAPADSLRLDTNQVSVPANGRATVTLAVNAEVGPTGPYGGVITATTRDGSTPIRSTVSFYSAPQTFPLTITVADSHGAATEPGAGDLTITRDDYNWAKPQANDPFVPAMFTMPLTNGTGTIQVPGGRYSTSTVTVEQDLTVRRANLLVATATTVDKPTTVSLDARKAVPVGATDGQPTDVREQYVSVQRDLPSSPAPAASAFLAPSAGWQVYVTPTAPTTTGSVSAADRVTLSQSLVDMEIGSPNRVALHPLYDPFSVAGKLHSDGQVALALAGSASAADIRAASVKNKLAVVPVTVPPGTPNPTGYVWQAVQQAASTAGQQGAVALVPYVDAADALPIAGLTGSLPVLSLSGKEGRQLAELARSGHLTLSLSARSKPGYMDNLFFHNPNGISADQVRQVDHHDLVEVPTRYHGDVADVLFKKQWFAFPVGSPFGMALTGTLLRGPTALTEYIGPADSQVYWKRGVSEFAPDAAGNPDRSTMFSLISNDVYRAAGHRPVENWFQAPIHGGGAQQSSTPAGNAAPVLCALCLSDTRQFVPSLQWMDSTPGHTVDPWQSGQYLPAVQLFQDDKQISAVGGLPIAAPEFSLPGIGATYRLQSVDSVPAKAVFGWPSAAIQHTATQTTTSWTFRPVSSVKAPLPPGYHCLDGWSACSYQPLLQVSYDLGLDLLNQAPAGQPHTFAVTVGYHPLAQTPAQITQLQLWYSADDGASWQRADVSTGYDGHYTVRVNDPPLSATTGFVSLRVQASDLSGNRMSQTVLRAYALTEHPAG
jgi:Subtilase family